MRYGVGDVYIQYDGTLTSIEVQDIQVNFIPIRYEVCEEETGWEDFQKTQNMKIEITITYETVQEDIVNIIRKICNASTIYFYPDYTNESTLYFEVFAEESFTPLQLQAGYTGTFTMRSKEPQPLTSI